MIPGGSEVKESACNVGDLGWIPRSGRSPGEGHGNPLQYSSLENPMDREACLGTPTFRDEKEKKTPSREWLPGSQRKKALQGKRMINCVQFFATLWAVAHGAPLYMGFSREEYWSGLPWSPPGDLPNPGIKPRSSALQVESLPPEPPGRLSCDLK